MLMPVGWWILIGVVIGQILAFVFLPKELAFGIMIAVGVAFIGLVLWVLAHLDLSH